MPPQSQSIAVLPDAVVDQIAAGEVVERPASVVKELLENALDAGAQSIDIDVDEGGRTRIRVADDGSGMGRDDAVLALTRYATSKIRVTADLVGVASFGFRGEALPAIASVSRLELETAFSDGRGTRITVDGGAVIEISDAARRRGTTVTVRDLFANAPTRMAFLRSARSEWRSILEIVTTIALLRRDVRLTVTHDGRPALSLPAAPMLRARVAALWGAGYADNLVTVDDVSGAVHVAGLVERPADVGTAGRRVWVCVNGRAIRDGGLVRAAESAYRSTIPAGVRPTVLLGITIPAEAVDVNVHPTKAEVRFRERWWIERAVESAVRRALGSSASAAAFQSRDWSRPTTFGAAGKVDVEVLRASTVTMGPLLAETSRDATSVGAQDGIEIPALVQIRRTYLMFERDEGLVLIDQHSAHERVLYEEFMGMLESGASPSQRLLFPMTLHLGPAEGEAFEAHREPLERLGFEIEGFGGHTLLVRSVPLPHPRFDAERCLRDTLDALTGDRAPGTTTRHERLAATVACKAAIKAGDTLSLGEMRALYATLARTKLPAHDVHGRSTIVYVPWDEVERRFGRR